MDRVVFDESNVYLQNINDDVRSNISELLGKMWGLYLLGIKDKTYLAELRKLEKVLLDSSSMEVQYVYKDYN